MKCSVYIATSVDGFIAREDGSIDWLESSGNQEADMGEHADMGFEDYISSIDCMVMGRNTMELISGFNLTPSAVAIQRCTNHCSQQYNQSATL